MKKSKITILSFFPFTKGFRLKYLAAFFLVVLGVIANYLTPQVIRITVDSVIGTEPFALPGAVTALIQSLGGRDFLAANIMICAAAALFLSLFSVLCDFGSRASLARACEGTLERIRNRLFGHIQKLPYNWHNNNQTGDIIQRCTMDVDMIRTFISDQLLALLKTVFLIVVALFLMFPMNFEMSMIAVAFIPVTLIYSAVFYVLTAKKFHYADECEGQLTALVQENLTGVRVVRAFGRERFEIDKFKKKNDEFAALWVKLGKVMGLNWGLGDFISFLQIIVVMIVGIFFSVSGKITVGEFLAFVSYNSMLVWPIRSLGRILSELSKTTISSIRLFDILNAETEQDCENPITPDMSGDIEFKDVSFRYNQGSETLKDVSFKIKSGGTLGILGATGSGKSTLMYLLDRLYELPRGNGAITIGGVDIRDISLTHLRKNIGIVLQEPFLFSKSFRESISDGAVNHDLESVRKYARIAVIDDTIKSFSDGYDTQIGERGVTISGGQKQRVAIARMLMQDTPIKIFDDSLSAVDMETDAKIRDAIKTKVHGTTILIAHRITTIMNADLIVVIDKGQLVQSGTHSELIQTDGIYKRIYDTQRSGDNT
ncbi:MAG: ABC transporter ATP-binding protein [Oscillospiraceae bacterium]